MPFSGMDTSYICDMPTLYRFYHALLVSLHAELSAIQKSESDFVPAYLTIIYGKLLAFLSSRYIAIYPYTPRKEDELELRKGEMFLVFERCQDGWFKGTSMHTSKIGVFPGNYVAPVTRYDFFYTEL